MTESPPEIISINWLNKEAGIGVAHVIIDLPETEETYRSTEWTMCLFGPSGYHSLDTSPSFPKEEKVLVEIKKMLAGRSLGARI